MTAGNNFHPQFPRSPLVTPGTMIPLLARTQARLTTYFSDLCFKSLASNFFFPVNKFLLSTQKTPRLSQLLKQKGIINHMTTAYFSSLPPLKQKLWGNFHDYERALVTTEQEN